MSEKRPDGGGKPIRKGFVAFLAAAALAFVWLGLTNPRHDRDWADDVARLPIASSRPDGSVLISNVREWDYDRSGPVTRTWTDRSYDPKDLKALWFNLDPFPAWSGVAHTYLVFEFAEGTEQRYLAVSVEARKQRHEGYSGLKGLFRQYELIYVWASEADILKRRGLYLREDIYQYRLDLSVDRIQAVFRAFLDQTNALAKTPRFYNTLISNCTNELAKTVRRSGGEIPWHYSFHLTGYSDRYLHSLGYVGGKERDFSAIRGDALRNSSILAAAQLQHTEFSDALRRLR